MSKLPVTTRRIVRFRMARPLLDLAILFAALSVLVGLRNIEMEQQLNRKPNLQIQPQLPASKTLFIEEQFNTENQLWQAWSNWINTEQPGSGQCLLETRPTPVETPFYLLCFGKKRVGNRMEISVSNTLAEKNVFVLTEAPRAIKAEKPPANITEPTYKVQGWMNTQQGQKTFDPVQKKWLP